jgi:mRNA interferase MazF
MTMASFPHQGEIYLSRALRQGGDTKKRPVVVVSIDVRNQYSTTLLGEAIILKVKGMIQNLD